MLKTEIVRRIRIRGQFSNFGHLGRIPVEILEPKSRIRKSSSIEKVPDSGIGISACLIAHELGNTEKQKLAFGLEKKPGSPCKPCRH